MRILVRKGEGMDPLLPKSVLSMFECIARGKGITLHQALLLAAADYAETNGNLIPQKSAMDIPDEVFRQQQRNEVEVITTFSGLPDMDQARIAGLAILSNLATEANYLASLEDSAPE